MLSKSYNRYHRILDIPHLSKLLIDNVANVIEFPIYYRITDIYDPIDTIQAI